MDYILLALSFINGAMATPNTQSKVSKKLEKRFTKSGFTLAELIVVVSILAVLATIGFLALSGYQQDAKKAVASTNVRSVYTAISTESS
ncbi:MAG: hypothetical protein QG650_746, partial [Patescibacteria group bacterium]|nr:hypothetical protein [Patescibacteria group bacterium]